MNPNVVTRFPPSPTGQLQVGNIRTAIFNYLYAKKNGGKFVLRLEDTDRERSKKEYEEGVIADMEWLGFSYDDFARQTDRVAIHREYLEKLIAEGKAYLSKEEVEEGKRAEVIRFKNPNRSISFHDAVRGEITIDTTDLGDFVIAKSLDEPLYHLGVIVDDFLMGITHVIRGEDHISNTPRQILLIEAIGSPIPEYAHLPLILSPDRTKLSKRNGSVSLKNLREQGYLKEAIINFLALLGWNPGTEQELFTLEELIAAFDIAQIQKGGGIFNIDRLNWFNREYIKRLDDETFLTHLKEWLPNNRALEKIFTESKAARTDLTQRITTLGEISTLAEAGEFAYYMETPNLVSPKLLFKEETASATTDRLKEVVRIIESIPEGKFDAENIKEHVFPYAEKEGKGQVLWPMRYALSGKDRSPDPFTIAEAIGRKETLMRLHKAITIVQG